MSEEKETKATGCVSIKLTSERVDPTVTSTSNLPRFYTPGEVISNLQDYMRGHGTYTENDYLKSSVAGVIHQVNKLICVVPLKSRYNGQVGDVIVGRVTEVQQKRWKVDTNSRLSSLLLLSSVNLPGGELRRRSAEDAQQMRKYLQEGDLVSAEVQSIYSDGSLSIHTRSLKYGKLSQGTMIKVFPSLVKRRKNHFHNLPCGVSLIIGNNGFIWMSPRSITPERAEAQDDGGYKQNLQPVALEDRQMMARVRNCIAALVASKVMLDDTSISYAVEESFKYERAALLLDPEAMLDVAALTQHRLNSLQEHPS